MNIAKAIVEEARKLANKENWILHTTDLKFFKLAVTNVLKERMPKRPERNETFNCDWGTVEKCGWFRKGGEIRMYDEIHRALF